MTEPKPKPTVTSKGQAKDVALAALRTCLEHLEVHPGRTDDGTRYWSVSCPILADGTILTVSEDGGLNWYQVFAGRVSLTRAGRVSLSAPSGASA